LYRNINTGDGVEEGSAIETNKVIAVRRNMISQACKAKELVHSSASLFYLPKC
jgi:hypothetical protein